MTQTDPTAGPEPNEKPVTVIDLPEAVAVFDSVAQQETAIKILEGHSGRKVHVHDRSL